MRARSIVTWSAAVVAGLCASVAAPVAAPAAAAQSLRAEVAFVDTWRPAMLLSYEVRTPIGREPPLPGDTEEGGPVFAVVRDYFVSAMLGAGITIARVDRSDVSGTAIGQLGVLRRLHGSLEPRVGLYAVGIVRPEAAGPLLRFEAKDAFGAQLGWVWFSGSSRKGLIGAVDVSLALVRDLIR
ncbi:MAG: hypothetical protein WKG32_11380 [Gemmatimonadaceae bacterium]